MVEDRFAEIQQELHEIHARIAHKSSMLTRTIQFFLLLHEEGEIRHRELVLRLTVLEHAVQGLAQRMAADPEPSHEPGDGSRQVGSVLNVS
jgi:ATP-dependent DNA ligase